MFKHFSSLLQVLRYPTTGIRMLELTFVHSRTYHRCHPLRTDSEKPVGLPPRTARACAPGCGGGGRSRTGESVSEKRTGRFQSRLPQHGAWNFLRRAAGDAAVLVDFESFYFLSMHLKLKAGEVPVSTCACTASVFDWLRPAATGDIRGQRHPPNFVGSRKICLKHTTKT